MIPLVVVEGPSIALEHAIREVAEAGWTVEPGFGRTGRRGVVVRTGVVDSDDSAALALLAALGGSGLVVHAIADRLVIDRLVDDLRRLAPVDHRIGEPIVGPAVGPQARAILGLLAEGHSLGEAADILGLPRRTADRRLAEGRRALGVERTTEAIARARRLGWLHGHPTGD